LMDETAMPKWRNFYLAARALLGEKKSEKLLKVL